VSAESCGPHRLDRLKQSLGIGAAAQARFPRPGRGVIDGRDPIADRLPVAVDQRHVDREIDAGARHHLPLEGVAMQIDNARQHHQSTSVEAKRTAALVRTDGTDLTVSDPQRGFVNFAAEQGPAALNEDIGHDAAP
jgi:hypothetical protein